MSGEQGQRVCSDKDTKQHILDATVDLISEEGVEHVTLRRIAARAKVNLALVNYHYRSKDNLLNEAIRTLISHFDAALSALEDDSLPPCERLKRFFKQYIESLSQFPGLARHIMDKTSGIVSSFHRYSQYSKTMKRQKMVNALREITGEQNEKLLMLMINQLFGALLSPVITHSCPPSDNRDESQPFYRLPSTEDQVDFLFDHYFHKYEK